MCNRATEHFQEKKYPLLNWEKQLFELHGGKDLSNFELVDEKEQTYPISINSTKEAHESGSIVFKNKMLFFQKELVGSKINLKFEPLTHSLVTSTAYNVSGEFASKVGGDKYGILVNYVPNSEKLVRVIINEGKEILFDGKVLERTEKSVLLSNGDLIKIKTFISEDKNQQDTAWVALSK